MIVIPRSLVRIQLARDSTYIKILVEWPSGLRRQVKALISSEARVRIPSQPLRTYVTKYLFLYGGTAFKYYACAYISAAMLFSTDEPT